MPLQIKLPVFRQINTFDYETQTIQSNVSKAFGDSVAYIKQLNQQKTIVNTIGTYTFVINAAKRNDYLMFSNDLFDPFNNYNVSNGVFTASVSDWHTITVNMLLNLTAPGDAFVAGQVNKVNLDPQATQATNYDIFFTQVTSSGNKASINATRHVFLNKNDEFKVYLYCSTDNPFIADNRDAEVSFSW